MKWLNPALRASVRACIVRGVIRPLVVGSSTVADSGGQLPFALRGACVAVGVGTGTPLTTPPLPAAASAFVASFLRFSICRVCSSWRRTSASSALSWLLYSLRAAVNSRSWRSSRQRQVGHRRDALQQVLGAAAVFDQRRRQVELAAPVGGVGGGADLVAQFGQPLLGLGQIGLHLRLPGLRRVGDRLRLQVRAVGDLELFEQRGRHAGVLVAGAGGTVVARSGLRRHPAEQQDGRGDHSDDRDQTRDQRRPNGAPADGCGSHRCGQIPSQYSGGLPASAASSTRMGRRTLYRSVTVAPVLASHTTAGRPLSTQSAPRVRP